MAIHFFTENISFVLDKEEKITAWIEKVIIGEGYTAKNINYIFCSDDHLLTLNQEYLNHDTLTDIITFDHSEQSLNLEADIYVSIDRVRDNASSLKNDFAEELHRVLIHGLLHLIGLEDKTEADRQVMRRKEDACLSLR